MPFLRTLFCLCLLFWSMSAVADNQKVAVLAFTGKGAPESALQGLTDAARGGALDMLPPEKFTLITRENMMMVLKDQGKDASCLSGECEVEIGRNIGADYVLTGKFTDKRGLKSVKLQLYETAKGALTGQEIFSERGFSALEERVAQETKGLIASGIPGAGFEGSFSVGTLSMSKGFDRGDKIVNKPTDKSGFLFIQSKPSGAEIYINGEPAGQAPLQLDKPVGKYVVVAEKGSLYHPARKELKLEDEATANIELELKPAYGTLKITTSPKGAEVVLSGELKGETPYVKQRVPRGVYNLQIKKRGYFPLKKRIIVEDGKTADVQLKLDKSVGSMSFKSSPSKAEVWLNGEPVGLTPLTLKDKPPGNYKVRLSKEKYFPHEFTLKMKAGDDVGGQRVTLRPNFGHLEIDSVPRGAAITLNGKKTGKKTPYTFKQLQAGIAIVELYKAGHGRYKDRVDVFPDAKTNTVQPKLDAKLGTLAITSVGPDGQPCRGDVWLGGKNIGKTPLKKRILAVSHELTVKCGGMKGVQSVRIRHNEKTSVTVKVAPYTAADVNRLNRDAGLALLLDGVLAVGGSVSLGLSYASFNAMNTALDASLSPDIGSGEMLQYMALRDDYHAQRQNTVIYASVGVLSVVYAVWHHVKTTRVLRKEADYAKEVVGAQ